MTTVARPNPAPQLPPSLRRARLPRWRARQADNNELSPRELEVLRALALGLSDKELSERLNIALPTVKNHLMRVREKLGAKNRAQAVVLGIQYGLIEGPMPVAKRGGSARARVLAGLAVAVLSLVLVIGGLNSPALWRPTGNGGGATALNPEPPRTVPVTGSENHNSAGTGHPSASRPLPAGTTVVGPAPTPPVYLPVVPR